MAFHMDFYLRLFQKRSSPYAYKDYVKGHTFKADVLETLKEAFGEAVKAGPNAIKIEGDGNRRDSDVLVAAQFRRYRKFPSSASADYEPGICFFTSAGRVVNYPKQHSANCKAKHQATEKCFKPAVRSLRS
jgi:hypothetical protein